jgi:two-component system, OmpR family, phosphate regulon sensor histidine kinase PhoR
VAFRLHSRLVFLNGCAICITTLLVGFFLGSGVKATVESEVEDQLKRSAALAREYISLHPDGDDPVLIASDLARSLDVRVTIIGQDGVVLGDSGLAPSAIRTVENHLNRPEVIEALKTGEGTSIRWSSTVSMPFIYVASKADTWIVRLAKPLSSVDVLIGRLRGQLFLAMLLSLGMTLVFGYMVYVFVSRPLRQMADASRLLAVGNLDHRIPVVGDTDLSRIGASLNAMAARLRRKIDELVEDKQHLEAIVEAMSAGVVVFDRTARTVVANKAVREMLDLRGDLHLRTPMELVRHSGLENAVRRALQGTDVPAVEPVTAGGRVLAAKAAPVRQLSGHVERAVVVFHDLTELRRIERMRKDFVANVSHEFKTPLTSIRGYTETLLNDPPNDPGITAEFLQVIDRNAALLQALVEDLLVLSQLEHDPPLEKEEIDITELIEEQVQSRARLLEERAIELHVECPSVKVFADHQRLSRTIANLLDNAIHYNRPSGQIRIIGRETPRGFALDIADTGFGIPQQDLGRVFERFYRVEKSRTRGTGGTGLGLAIVRHAIESQGGSVSVKSKPGVGSTFTIVLPADKV